MKYRMLVVDVDGTLVNKEGLIAEEDKQAIRRLADSRVMVCLATGRVIDACKSILAELQLNNPHVFFDGALVYLLEGGYTLKSWPVAPELVHETVDFCREHDIYLELFARHTFFAEKTNWSDDIHRKFFHVGPKITSFKGIWDREEILKAEILVHNAEEETKSQLFQAHFDSRLRYSVASSPAFPEVKFINILNPAVSKGEAVKTLYMSAGMHQSEVVVIGDGHNDISMLKAAGISVAMGNAFDDVKAAAEYVTADVDNHGVAQAVNFFFPV